MLNICWLTLLMNLDNLVLTVLLPWSLAWSIIRTPTYIWSWMESMTLVPFFERYTEYWGKWQSKESEHTYCQYDNIWLVYHVCCIRWLFYNKKHLNDHLDGMLRHAVQLFNSCWDGWWRGKRDKSKNFTSSCYLYKTGKLCVFCTLSHSCITQMQYPPGSLGVI